MPQPPYDPPPPLNLLFDCVLLVCLGVFLLVLLLPRPWVRALLKTAFPFLPDKLDKLDKNDRRN